MLLNETEGHTMAPKRHFYEDDRLVVPEPGSNEEISSSLKEQESSHGNISFIQGMGIRTTPILEKYFNKFRYIAYEKLSIYESEFGTQKSAFLNEFRSLRNNVSKLIDEPVLPGLIYILTSTLTGSIVVNRRSFPLRLASPLVFGGVSLYHFMPRTFNNIKSIVVDYEKENFPEAYKTKNDAIKEIAVYRQMLRDGVQDSAAGLEKNIHKTRSFIIDFFK